MITICNNIAFRSKLDLNLIMKDIKIVGAHFLRYNLVIYMISKSSVCWKLNDVRQNGWNFVGPALNMFPLSWWRSKNSGVMGYEVQWLLLGPLICVELSESGILNDSVHIFMHLRALKVNIFLPLPYLKPRVLCSFQHFIKKESHILIYVGGLTIFRPD